MTIFTKQKILTMKRLLFILLSLILISCARVSNSRNVVRDLKGIEKSDTLRVLTMYGPVSYFLYKDNPMGYEYEMSKMLCEAIGVEMELKVAQNEESLIQMLENGEGDIIAYRLPYTTENKSRVAFTNKEYITEQVIIQCKSDTMLKDVLDLSSKKVYVRRGSRYATRLVDLNNEIGGGINIIYSADSLSSEDLIAMVATHQIPLTVSSDDMAKMGKTYFSNIDYSLGISFPQRSAWAVNNKSKELLTYVNEWNEDKSLQEKFKKVYLKYFEKSRYYEASGIPKIKNHSSISQYDDLFKRYSKVIGWDWKLLAAVVYKESKFDPTTVSWAGACGLMQLMPKTAKTLGIENEADMYDPEISIKAGAEYFKRLDKIFSSIEDPTERLKFTLAAYNSGPGHILDARALAVKYGKNPNVWSGNVEPYILLKSEPEYYTDEICKSGYCRGEEVVNYVDDVLSKWEQYKLWNVK